MKGFRFISVIGVAIVFIAASFTYRTAPTGSLSIRFNSYIGNSILKLDTITYTTELNQPFTITKFRYYIGNIQLKKKDGSTYSSKGYYLLDEDEPASKSISMEGIPEGEYVSVSFLIGVDSMHNCSGAQSGALDPVNGMFWSWNTGYIFLKLEGKSPVSGSPGHIFEFHIGGYKVPNNCIRQASLSFAKPLILRSGKAAQVNIKADAAELLKTPTTVDLAKLSSVTDFHNATTIADNYMDMFSIMDAK